MRRSHGPVCVLDTVTTDRPCGWSKHRCSDVEHHRTDGDTTKPNISDLPIELMIKIIGFLPPSEICKTIAPVCRHWRYLAYDPVRWRSLDIDESKLSSAVSGGVPRLMPMLVSLTVRQCQGRDLVPNVVVSYYRRYRISRAMKNLFDVCSVHCRKLREIRLQFVSAVNSELVGTLVDRFPELRALSLKGCERVDSKCIIEICRLTRLVSLDVSLCSKLCEGNGRVIDNDVRVIAASLTELESLDIDQLNVTDELVGS